MEITEIHIFISLFNVTIDHSFVKKIRKMLRPQILNRVLCMKE